MKTENPKNKKNLASTYVGLDVDKKEIKVCLLDEQGVKIDKFHITNSLNGFHQLIENLFDHPKPLFAVESTGTYSGNLTHFLRQISAQLVVTNPFYVARLREAFTKSVKTDDIDAYVIAMALRMDVLKDSQKADEYFFLQDLLERWHDLSDRHTALSNQLRSALIQIFPEVDACFSDISCNAALAILSSWQTAKDLLVASEVEILNNIRKNNGRIDKKKLTQLREDCLGSSGWKTTKVHRTIIKSQVVELQLLNQQLKEIGAATDEYCLRFNRQIELLKSVPGVGKKVAYQFLAIIGDHERFDPKGDGKGAKRLSSYLGFGLVEYSSGPTSYKKGCSKRGNNRLRGMLYMSGLVTIRYDADLKNQYEAYKTRSGSGKKGVNALAHTLARRCYGVLKSGKLYDANIPLQMSTPRLSESDMSTISEGLAT